MEDYCGAEIFKNFKKVTVYVSDATIALSAYKSSLASSHSSSLQSQSCLFHVEKTGPVFKFQLLRNRIIAMETWPQATFVRAVSLGLILLYHLENKEHRKQENLNQKLFCLGILGVAKFYILKKSKINMKLK